MKTLDFGLELNYNSAKNTPILLNNIVIGVVKNYNESGVIECIIWDKYIDVIAKFNDNNAGIIDGIIIKEEE